MTHPLPAQGQPWDAVRARMTDMAGSDVKWRDGKAAVYVLDRKSVV